MIRVLHIKEKHEERYIPIDKIESFIIFKEKNPGYEVDLMGGRVATRIAVNTDNPNEVIETLIKTIDITDNRFIEYTVKGEE